MKTSQQGVLSPRAIQQKRTTPFLGKIVKPHVFSQIIQSHGSVIQQSNHRTIVSHQILNPEYNPQSPQLKVEIPPSPTAGASHASVSSSTGSPHLHSNRKLPARSPLNTRSDIRSSSSSASSDIQRSPSDMNRPTTLELEKILIEEKAALKKMQMEAEASRKVYTKTKRQMLIKISENQQKAKKLVDSVQTARSSLESLQSWMPANPGAPASTRGASTTSTDS